MMRQTEDSVHERLLDRGTLGCTGEQWNSLGDLKKSTQAKKAYESVHTQYTTTPAKLYLG